MPLDWTSIGKTLAVGGALFYGVQKFFEVVGDKLTDDTRLEIAVWLFDRKKLSPAFQSWPDTFAKIFDRVFGDRHLSWKCFLRSCVASYLLSGLCAASVFNEFWDSETAHKAFMITVGLVTLVCNVIPDYISLLETRFVLGLVRRRRLTSYSLSIVIDCVFTTVLAGSAAVLGTYVVQGYMNPSPPCPTRSIRIRDFFDLIPFVPSPFVLGSEYREVLPNGMSCVGVIIHPGMLGQIWFYPAFFTSIWLWLYAGSGLLLKAARRFDIGFDWFNRRFDIEKKPLQSIGLVAGAIVAIGYWSVALIMHLV